MRHASSSHLGFVTRSAKKEGTGPLVGVVTSVGFYEVCFLVVVVVVVFLLVVNVVLVIFHYHTNLLPPPPSPPLPPPPHQTGGAYLDGPLTLLNTDPSLYTLILLSLSSSHPTTFPQRFKMGEKTGGKKGRGGVGGGGIGRDNGGSYGGDGWSWVGGSRGIFRGG